MTGAKVTDACIFLLDGNGFLVPGLPFALFGKTMPVVLTAVVVELIDDVSVVGDAAVVEIDS